MLLIGNWYDLSDRHVEDIVSENLSAMKFCENNVPDHTVLSRFRTKLTEQLCQKVQVLMLIKHTEAKKTVKC